MLIALARPNSTMKPHKLEGGGVDFATTCDTRRHNIKTFMSIVNLSLSKLDLGPKPKIFSHFLPIIVN